MAGKLGITVDEFGGILKQPCKTYKDYPNDLKKLNLLRKLKRMITNKRFSKSK